MNAATLLCSRCPRPRPRRCCRAMPSRSPRSAPGTAQFVLAACDYVENPWGDYNELNLGFLVRPVGAPDDVIGSFVYRMPVNQAFTCEAGNRGDGLPQDRRGASTPTTPTATSRSASTSSGQHRLQPSPCPGPRRSGEPERIETESYSYLDGVAHATPLSMDMGTGFVDPADVVLELGEGPVADELRSLGLPGTLPDLCHLGRGPQRHLPARPAV